MTTYREIFLRAAEIADKRNFGPYRALRLSCAYEEKPHTTYLKTLVLVREYFGYSHIKINQGVFALLFMAEIAGQPDGIDEQLGLV